MNILVIGGTGIIGRALLRLAASTGATSLPSREALKRQVELKTTSGS